MSKEKFKVIIAGSRIFEDFPLLKRKVDFLLSEKIKTHEISIISGTARGADSLGEDYAKHYNYKILEYPANWKKFGMYAGHLRNSQMVEIADAAIFFSVNNSRGTRDCYEKCLKKRIPARIFYL